MVKLIQSGNRRCLNSNDDRALERGKHRGKNAGPAFHVRDQVHEIRRHGGGKGRERPGERTVIQDQSPAEKMFRRKTKKTRPEVNKKTKFSEQVTHESC